MFETLVHIDHRLFYLVNHTMSNFVFDVVCVVLREKLVWIPVYVIIAYLFYRKYGWNMLWFLALAGITILLSDQLSSGLIKPLVHRARPCNNPDLNARLLLASGCNGFSFVSSHAANHFALATFLYFFVKQRRGLVITLFLWAAAISFSQIYVGLHYPFDVFCGAVLGIIIGFSTGKVAELVALKFIHPKVKTAR